MRAETGSRRRATDHALAAIRRPHITRLDIGALPFVFQLDLLDGLDLRRVVPVGAGVIVRRAGVAVMLLDTGLILVFPGRRVG